VRAEPLRQAGLASSQLEAGPHGLGAVIDLIRRQRSCANRIGHPDRVTRLGITQR
jgi:hypothetical protein